MERASIGRVFLARLATVLYSKGPTRMSTCNRVLGRRTTAFGLLAACVLSGLAAAQTHSVRDHLGPQRGAWTDSGMSASSLQDVHATSVRPTPIQHGIPPAKAGPEQIPNVSMDAGSFCSGSCSPVITQAPDLSTLYFADQGCDFCGGGSQVLAEDFNLGATQEICEIVYWG